MTFMFMYTSSLKYIPPLNTSKVTSMSCMFWLSGATQLPDWDTSKVTNMSTMFSGAVLDILPAWDVSKVTSFTLPSGVIRSKLLGTKYSVSYASCYLSRASLIEIFNNLGTASGQTITITGNPGVASLTSEDRLIATAKGWTISG